MAEQVNHMDLLKRVRLFTDFGDEDMAKVDALLQERRYRKGQVIFEQGQVGDALYIVESGRIKATVTDEGEKEKIIALFGEGDYFGEMALLSAEGRSATATSVGDSQVLVLPKSDFEGFLANNLQIMRHFLNVMSRRVTELNVRAQRGEEEQQAMVLGKVIVLFSPKGGVGKTTLAVNLATALRQEANKAVCLVDCSYPFGDAGVMLNLEPRRTIADLLPQINELDGQIFESVLQSHSSGMKVLLAPPSPEESELVTGEHVNLILTRLRELFEFIIVDTHGTFSEVALAALDVADLTLVVTTMETPALKNVRVFLATMEEKLGYPVEKLAVVVNRFSTVGGLTLADVESSVSHKVTATVVSQGPIAVTAANQGMPFAISNRGSRIYRDIADLAKLIAPYAMEPTVGGLFEEEEEFVPTLGERLRSAPRDLVTSVREGITDLTLAELTSGVGRLLMATAPLFFLVAVLAGVAGAMGTRLPGGNLIFNLSIWLGIGGGSFWLIRSQEPRKHPWVLGMVTAVFYGAVLLFASLAIANIAGIGVNTPIPGLLFVLITYAVFGLVGSLVAERLRRSPESLIP